MEWYDYEPEPFNEANTSQSKDVLDEEVTTTSCEEEECSRTSRTSGKDASEDVKDTNKIALDDLFQSLLGDVEDTKSNNDINSDEQTLSTTAKSVRSNKSVKSQQSQQSVKSTRSHLSLTEQLDKISNDEGKKLEDDDRSASAMSWFSWRKPKKTVAIDAADINSGSNQEGDILNDLDNADDRVGDGIADANPEEDNIQTDIKIAEGIISYHPEQRIYSLNAVEEDEHLDIDFVSDLVERDESYDSDFNAIKDIDHEHPNQAMFDIIEQGFDSIDPFYVRGMERALKTNEVKLCFAAYVFVFSPPTPTHFAREYNHSIDKDLREERLHQNKVGADKKGWFKSKWNKDSHENKRKISKLERTDTKKVDEEEYTYEIVPSSIVFAAWTEVLLHFGIDLFKLSEKKRDDALVYLRDSLVQVGLLDSSFIDLSGTSDSSTINSEIVNECEYIAAHHAINGQYGQYLRDSYTKIGECLEQHKVDIFHAVSKIPNRADLSMRDYCSGMLPYTLTKALIFSRVQELLCDESFVRRRLDYFGLLEGATVHITDIEIMIENCQTHHKQEDIISGFVKGSHDAVKDQITQRMTNQGGISDSDLFEEVGKAFHLLAVSLIAHGMDEKGLEFFNEALEFKEKCQSPLDPKIGNITISDTLHCIGVAYGHVGDLDNALSHFKQALVIRRELLGDDDLRVAETCHKMGSTLCEVGKLDDATTLLEEALRIRQDKLDEGHESIAETEEWMGNVLREQRDFVRALEFYRHSLKSKREIFGDSHEEVANATYTLAITLDCAGKYEAAIMNFKEALRIRNLLYGRGIVLADTYLCMGNTYLELGKQRDAYEHFKESITIREDLLNSGDSESEINFISELTPPSDELSQNYSKLLECYEAFFPLFKQLNGDTATTVQYLKRMGEYYFKCLDYERAMGRFQVALDIEGGPDSVELQQCIGKISILNGEYKEAKKILIQCLTIQKAEHGDHSLTLFRTMYYLGISLHHMGQHSHSLSIMLSAENILQSTDRDTDVRTAHTQFWVGKQYFAEKEFQQSSSYFLKALAGYKEFCLNDIDIIVQTLHSLGNAQLAMGEKQLALKSYNGAITLVEKNGKAQCTKSYSEVQFSAGELYGNLESYDEARECYEKSLKSLPAGSNDKVAAATLGALGSVYMKQAKHTEAKEVLTGAYNMFKESIGPHSDDTISTAYRLANLLDIMHSYRAAMEYYEICLNAKEIKLGKGHKTVGAILFNMGKNFFSQFEYDTALNCLERALAIRKKELPPNHSDCADTFYELGKCYVATDKTDKAVLCHREAHRIWKGNKKSTDAGAACFDLAGLYEEQQQNSLAASSYAECLELLSSNSKVIPQLHYRLGTLYNTLDNSTGAIFHYRQYLELLNPDGSGDDTYLVTIRSLAQLYAKERRFEESFVMYDELIQFLEVTDEHEGELGTAYHDIGKIHLELKNLDEALENIQTSLGIRKATENSESHVAIGKALLDLAKVFCEKKEYDSATNTLLEAVFLFKLKRNYKDRILALRELAHLYETMDKTEEAKECFEDILDIQKVLLKVSDSAIVETLCTFSSLLVNMSESERALELLQQALSISEKSCPGSMSHVATLQKIGELQMENMQYDKALKTLRRAIQLWPDECLEEAADCNRNAAVILCTNNQAEEAIPCLHEAVKIYRKCDFSDERLSSSLHLLGKALSTTSNLSLARECATEALSLRELIPGTLSLEYAQSLACLGTIEYQEGQVIKALPMFLQAMDIYKSSPEDVMWDYVELQYLVAGIHYLAKDHEIARRTVESSLLICNEKFPDEYEMISNLHLLRGKLYIIHKNLSGAYDQFKRCLSIRKRDGKEKQSVLEVLMEIAGVLFEQNQYKSCLDYYQEAARIMSRLDKTQDAFTVYERVGICHLRLEKYQDAMRAFKEAQHLFSTTPGNIDDRQVGRAVLSYYIGRAYEGLKQPEDALTSYLDTIGAFGLIQNTTSGDKATLAATMYRTGCLLTNKSSEVDRAAKMLENALEIRRAVLGSHDVEIADTLYQLAKNSSALATPEGIVKATKMLKEAESIYSRHKKYRGQASCLSELGSHELRVNLDTSFAFFKKAWSLYLTHELEQDSEAGSILYGMGFIHNQKLKASMAADLLKQSLKLRIQHEGKCSLNVGKTCEQLGFCLMALGQHGDALKLYVTCLEIYKDELGEDTMECARVMLDIAALYSYKQQFDLALLQLHGSLEFMEGAYGAESEQVATVLLRIGQVHDMRVDNEEAMKCVSRALQIRIKLYTKEDIRVAETYLICGKLLEDWDDIEEAMNCFQNALAIFQLKKGLEDTQVATIHDQIAGIYVEQGDCDAAIESYNEALSIYQVQLGERSSEVGHTLRNLGAIYDSKQDYETSYKYYMDALKILRQSLGDNDLSVGLVLNNIGINLARQKKYRKAIDLCTVSLRIRRSQLPKNHLEIADTLINLAHILDDCNKDSQALKFYKEALSIYKSNFGNESEDAAIALKNIGCINIRQDDLIDAIVNLSEALDIFKMKQGIDSIEVANILHHLGRIYGKQTEYQKSFDCFEESLQIRSKLLPSGHRDIVDTKRFVGAIRRKIALDNKKIE